MAVVLETVTDIEGQEAAGAITIAKPAGTASGDGLVFVCQADGSGAYTDYQSYTPEVDEQAVTGQDWLATFAKVAGGSEPETNYVFVRAEGTEAWAAGLLRFSGINTAGFIGAVSTITQGTADGTLGPHDLVSPAVVAEQDDSLIVRVWAFQSSSQAKLDSFTPPGTEAVRAGAGTPEAVVITTEAGPGHGVSSGTVNGVYTSGSTTPYAAWTFEVLPAGLGGGFQAAWARNSTVLIR